MNTPSSPQPSAPPADPARVAIGGAVRAFSGVTLLSRVGGLARDLLLIRVFGGPTAISSAFVSAFAIPNMFRRLFGEGALSAAFIPEYTRAAKDDPAHADRLASLTLTLLLLATTGVTVLAEVVLLAVLWAAPGNADRVLLIQLLMVMLPFMPLICAAAILGGMLQVHGRFGPSATGPLILNGFIITAGMVSLTTGWIGGTQTAFVMGSVTVASGLTQCVWFLLILRPHVRWTRVFTGTGDTARRMLRRFVPVMLGLGTLQINALLDTLWAAWPLAVGPTVFGFAYPMDDRSASVLAFTQRLYQFPLGVFGIAVATAVFPMLSRHADDGTHFAAILRRGLRLSMFIGVPAAVGLAMVRHDLVATLFSGRHGFTQGDLDRAAMVLLGFAPGVVAYSLNHVFTRAFYARGEMTTPMRVAIGTVALNLVLNLVLIWPFGHAGCGEAGLAWATTISATVQCVVLARLSRRFAGGPLIDREMARAIATTLAASAAMAGVLLLIHAMLPARTGWRFHAGSLAAACVAGASVYAGVAHRLGSYELRWLTHPRDER
ncbi:MAG: murein biosynthesis integral membrane protein MurJ [Phycisphaerales bacterium]